MKILSSRWWRFELATTPIRYKPVYKRQQVWVIYNVDYGPFCFYFQDVPGLPEHVKQSYPQYSLKLYGEGRYAHESR